MILSENINRRPAVLSKCRKCQRLATEVPHAGAHYDWGSTRAGKIGTAGSLVLIEGTAPVPPVHTSSVKVRQQVLKYQRTDGLKPILELTR